MKKYTRMIRYISLFVLVWQSASCSKPYDLDTPCPDYGKTCSQSVINNEFINELRR